MRGNRQVSATDRRFLRQALALAARGAGTTAPNPMVGALVVRGGRIVGRGFHRRAGEAHAEAVALAQAASRARGARLYVTLEPCGHFGRTPPCVDAIIGAGIREVVACMQDPDPRVNGRGFRTLRRAGIRVRVGVLRREAAALNAAFLRWVRNGRPLITLKAGMSLDGRIATRAGQSRWITSAAARREARRLRGRHDAVMVGIGTVLADDPRLLASGTVARQPARVVMDTRLRTPPGSRLLRGPSGGPAIVIAGRGAPAARRRRLEGMGALVMEVERRAGRVDFAAAVRALGRIGIRSVLVEGGSEILGSAIDARLADRVVLFVAPRILGGRKSLPAFGGEGAARPDRSVRIEAARWRRLGPDAVVEGRPRFPARRPGER